MKMNQFKIGDFVRVVAIPDTATPSDSVYRIFERMIRTGQGYKIRNVDLTNPNYLLVELDETTIQNGIEVYDTVLIEVACLELVSKA